MGKVIMSGIVPQLKAPSTSILASDLAVGSTVKLMENGVAVEYLVVNHGIPSDSSLYDSSCDGLWLLRKDIYTTMAFDSLNSVYVNSDVHAYLNSTFLGLFDDVAKSAIKPVKVLADGSQVDATVFLLSCNELGLVNSSEEASDEGCKLEYFEADTAGDSKRIAYLDGAATSWLTRSAAVNNLTVWAVDETGALDYIAHSNSRGIRPALILPSTALFDEETLILKGV